MNAKPYRANIGNQGNLIIGLDIIFISMLGNSNDTDPIQYQTGCYTACIEPWFSVCCVYILYPHSVYLSQPKFSYTHTDQDPNGKGL